MSNLHLPFGTNAWIFLNEDEPPKTNYNSPDSAFQSLIKYKVYDAVNFLGIAFFEVIDTPDGSSTIQIGEYDHSGGLTNQDYLDYIIRDARKVNPDIKFLTTMVYSGKNTLASIFKKGGDPQKEATDFANNLVTYLKVSGMNGLDVDWESDVSIDMTKEQFQILFSTLRSVFDKQSEKYYLSFTPAWPTPTIDYPTANSAFDFISPQFYDGTPLSSFLSAGLTPDKIGYGAQFEPGNARPNTSAQQVYSEVSPGFTHNNNSYIFQDIFMWRFNSGNFQFEQAQFMILNQLVYPPSGEAFDDSLIIGAAGCPNITQLTIRSGEVLNSILAVNTGTGPYNTGTENNGKGVFTLLQHGGDGGNSNTVNIPLDDPIVSISGYTGNWYGRVCVLQLSLTSKSGITYGPFGTMGGATSSTPFNQTAPAGQSVVAFNGTTRVVPMAGGTSSAIVISLNAVFG